MVVWLRAEIFMYGCVFQCSASCGTGAQRREVKCLNSEQIAAHDCRQEERPIIRHACNDRACNEGSFPLDYRPISSMLKLELSYLSFRVDLTYFWSILYVKFPLECHYWRPTTSPASFATLAWLEALMYWSIDWLIELYLLETVADESAREVEDTTKEPDKTQQKTHDSAKSSNHIHDDPSPASNDESKLMEHSSGCSWFIPYTTLPPTVQYPIGWALRRRQRHLWSEYPDTPIPPFFNTKLICIFSLFFFSARWKVRGQIQELPLGTAGQTVQTQVLFSIVLRLVFQIEDVRP